MKRDDKLKMKQDSWFDISNAMKFRAEIKMDLIAGLSDVCFANRNESVAVFEYKFFIIKEPVILKKSQTKYK